MNVVRSIESSTCRATASWGSCRRWARCRRAYRALPGCSPRMRRARRSLFVNPAQFSEGSDLAAYPPTSKATQPGRGARRRRALRPGGEEMYPPGFATWVEPAGAAQGLEGATAGHFRGVATVCLKLLNIVRPQVAWFGRKDAQQVAVVKQLVRDFNLAVEIRVVDTVRDRTASRSRPQRAPAPPSVHRHLRYRARSRPEIRRRQGRARARRHRARLRRRRRSRRPHARNRRSHRRHTPDRQRPTRGRRPDMTTRPRKAAPRTPGPASCRSRRSSR